MGYLLPILAAFFMGLWGTKLVRNLALRHDIIDFPGVRSSHVVPTPRGGGVAIVAGFVLGLLVSFPSSFENFSGPIPIIAVGSVAVALLGFMDDLWRLPALFRLGVQLVIALGLAWFGIRLTSLWLPFLGSLELGWASYPISALAMVAITNFYNFMDGIDGLAGGQALLVGSFLGLIAILTGYYQLVLPCFLTAAAAAGFLMYNFPPARIFMGDSGSLFLGFFFAAVAISLAASPLRSFPFVLSLLLLGTFIFDPLVTILRRIRSREPLLTAHRGHFYQRLNILGFSHVSITLGEYGLTFLLGLSALWALYLKDLGRFCLGLLWLILFVGLCFWILRMERRADLDRRRSDPET